MEKEKLGFIFKKYSKTDIENCSLLETQLSENLVQELS